MVQIKLLDLEQAIVVAMNELKENKFLDLEYFAHRFREKREFDDGTALPASWVIEFQVRKALGEERFNLTVSVSAENGKCLLIRPM